MFIREGFHVRMVKVMRCCLGTELTYVRVSEPMFNLLYDSMDVMSEAADGGMQGHLVCVNTGETNTSSYMDVNVQPNGRTRCVSRQLASTHEQAEAETAGKLR